MNIQSVIEHLNKKMDCELNTSYYSRIAEWRSWWVGFNKQFHQYKEFNGQQFIDRKLYSMNMAKKVCEDWASLLLNEKTLIVTDAQEFLDGVFASNSFWDEGNALVEKAFATGTGAFVVKIDDFGGAKKIRIEYLQADSIIPLSYRNGIVSEVAFASEVTEKGNKCVYLEMHVLEATGYVVKNFYLKSSGEGYLEQPLPENVAEKFITNSFVPMFALISPNIVNNFDDCNGLGMAVFANAIDQIIGVDLAFHNFNRDLKLGGKKVFYSEDLVQKDGAGNIITPDDVCQQLFTILKKDEIGALDGKTDWHEYNPDLRVSANKEAVQSQLDYLSFKCGFGTKHYQFNAGSIVTATQYTGDKQELVQNASKHYIVIERALRAVTKAILWAGDKLNEGTKIDIVFDDSIIIDKETERLRDIGEVNAGLKAKWEFRVKWYGETEAVAKKMADEIDSTSPPTGVI